MRNIGFLMIVSLVMGLAAIPTARAQDALAEAQKLLSAGKFESAIEKFDEVIEANPKSFEARIGLAKSYHWSGDSDTANFHAVKAEGLQPENIEAVEWTGFTFKAVGQAKIASGGDPTGSFDEAISSYSKASKLAPKDARFLFQLGDLYYLTSQFSESAAAFARGAKLAKKEAVYPYRAAQSYVFGQELDKAVAMIDKAVRIEPKNATYGLYKGQILEQKKSLAPAAKIYERVLVNGKTTDADGSNAARGLWRCYAPSEDWDSLISSFKKWSRKNRESQLPWWFLGLAQVNAKSHEAALDSFEKMAEVSPDAKPEAWRLQAVSLVQLQKLDKAASLFGKAAAAEFVFAADKNPINGLRSIMGTYFGQGDFEKACMIGEKHCLPFVGQDQKIWVLQDLGLFFRDWADSMTRRRTGTKEKILECNVKARDHYLAAVAEIPDHSALTKEQKAAIENDCGLMFHYNFKDPDSAVPYYKRALSYVPNWDDAVLNYGRILRGMDKLQEAEKLLTRGSNRQDIQDELRGVRRDLRK